MNDFECFEEDCGWSGDYDEVEIPEHDPDDLRCPRCHVRLIPAETVECSGDGNG